MTIISGDGNSMDGHARDRKSVKSRLIDAAAFAIGMIPAFLVGWHTDGFPWLLRLAMAVLSPGYFVGFPLLQVIGAIGLISFGFYFFISILCNGLIGWLTSYLTRNALRGKRAARIALGMGICVWVTWGVVYSVQAWPRPEPPPAPIVFASPLAGRWEGILRAPRGDRHVTVVCHPRADHTLGGYLYVHGADLGPFDEGTYAGDSLSFAIVGMVYRAHFDGTRMDMTVGFGRMSKTAELRFVSADTTRPARAPVDLGSPLAGRWEGVFHVPVRRAITLVFHPGNDGTLDGYFYSNGAELGRLRDGAWAADSLQFRLERIPYSAHFDSTTMSLTWWIQGKPRSMELRRAGADTSRPWTPQPNRSIQLPARGT